MDERFSHDSLLFYHVDFFLHSTIRFCKQKINPHVDIQLYTICQTVIRSTALIFPHRRWKKLVYQVEKLCKIAALYRQKQQQTHVVEKFWKSGKNTNVRYISGDGPFAQTSTYPY